MWTWDAGRISATRRRGAHTRVEPWEWNLRDKVLLHRDDGWGMSPVNECGPRVRSPARFEREAPHRARRIGRGASGEEPHAAAERRDRSNPSDSMCSSTSTYAVAAAALSAPEETFELMG